MELLQILQLTLVNIGDGQQQNAVAFNQEISAPSTSDIKAFYSSLLPNNHATSNLNHLLPF